MALTSTGLTNIGQGAGMTTNFQVQYESTLPNQANVIANANALLAVVENEFNVTTQWFNTPGGNFGTGNRQVVNLNLGDGSGANNNGHNSAINLDAQSGNSNRADAAERVKMLFMNEWVEILMSLTGGSWNSGDSSGEGLSQYAGIIRFPTGHYSYYNRGDNRLFVETWMNTVPRQDFVNTTEGTDTNFVSFGCALAFIFYLNVQLNFSITQIIAAGATNLAAVYRTLTGDSGDPFPFFAALLEHVYPSSGTVNLPGPIFDNPFPLAQLSFWVDKSTFGKDEVTDVIGSSTHGSFPDAFWLVLDGLNTSTFARLSIAPPALSGTFATLPGLTFSLNSAGVEFENTANSRIPQRIRFPFDVGFTNATLGSFPATPGAANTEVLNAVVNVAGNPLPGASASAEFELIAGADPYFTNIDPFQNNVFYLSQDLRIFTVSPGIDRAPVPGAPPMATDDFAGAYGYIQNLLGFLNNPANGFTDGSNDPFASGVIPRQGGALTADSSVSRFTVSGFPLALFNNYNFAVARVRLRGTAGPVGAAQNTKVFFRLWSTQTADTGFDPNSTYLSHVDGGKPHFPLPAPDSHTIPFFASGNAPNLSDPNNPEYGTSGFNNRTITIPSGNSVWAYFGCFLNVYDPGNFVNGSQVQALLAGTHHCLVAQIASDGAPIVNANGVVESPENSDKLAQRNLQLTFSDNPGPSATHRVPQTFDLKPGRAVAATTGDLLNYPDELMIDWGSTPAGSLAHIFWPQISAGAVLSLANRLYSTHLLSASDGNTITTTVIKGVTYVPIPAGTAENIAGLFTIDLPTTVTSGQEFNIVVRRVSTRQVEIIPGPKIARQPALGIAKNPTGSAPEGTLRSVGIDISLNPPGGNPVAPVVADTTVMRNWRYVVGTFQVKIPVTVGDVMLRPDEDALAVTRWRLQQLAATSRWRPVLQRHLEVLSGRVQGLGVDPNAIPASPDGAPLDIFQEGRGNLEIKFAAKPAGTVNDLADIFLKHHVLSDERVIRRWPTSQVLVIRNLDASQTGIYSVQALPDHHEAAGQFVTIREGQDTAVVLVLEAED
jgi:hypothetical protein